jgi:hypothetical protein
LSSSSYAVFSPFWCRLLLGAKYLVVLLAGTEDFLFSAIGLSRGEDVSDSEVSSFPLMFPTLALLVAEVDLLRRGREHFLFVLRVIIRVIDLLGFGRQLIVVIIDIL